MTAMQAYLEPSYYIDWQHPKVLSQAQRLSSGLDDKIAIVSACFNFVRDTIRHSWDYQVNPVTCKASEVLLHGTGYCYAKSHLLAALLRANGIPTGLCYQRLTIDGGKPPYSLHGLNAVMLPNIGWHRVDARGNKAGIDTQFNPPNEKLAFSIEVAGECDFPSIWPKPLPVVVDALENATTYQEVSDNLPDAATLPANTHPTFLQG